METGEKQYQPRLEEQRGEKVPLGFGGETAEAAIMHDLSSRSHSSRRVTTTTRDTTPEKERTFLVSPFVPLL